MNVIGHPYVAFKVMGRLTEDLVLGSYLPDIVPFVPDSVFEFEEIHKGGKKFLDFLDKHHPGRRDLALGMLCHSVEFGADKFSKEIEKRFEDKREELAKRIADASSISLAVASRARFHNFLWWGVDVQLLRHRRKFVEDLARKVSQIDIPEAAALLAKCFDKDTSSVVRDIEFLLKPMIPERFLSVRGLVEIWKDMAAGLPEKDQVDVEKTEKLFTRPSQKATAVKPWMNALGRVILRSFLAHRSFSEGGSEGGSATEGVALRSLSEAPKGATPVKAWGSTDCAELVGDCWEKIVEETTIEVKGNLQNSRIDL